MKRCGFIVGAALIAAFAGMALPGCSRESQADAWAEYNRQAQEETRLKKEAWTQYQKEMDEETRRKKEAWATFDEQLEKDGELQDRYEKVIAKWEEQAARFDRVLDAMEKQYGAAKNP